MTAEKLFQGSRKSNSPQAISQEIELEVQLNISSSSPRDDPLAQNEFIIHILCVTRSKTKIWLEHTEDLESILDLLKDKPSDCLEKGAQIKPINLEAKQ
jgi:hypothetical protein